MELFGFNEATPGSFLIALLFIITALQLGYVQLRQPRPEPVEAPPDKFSACRALTYLRRFASQPRPPGSEEHSRCREFLITEINKLGYKSELQQTFSVNQYWGSVFPAGLVYNILVRVPGKRPGNSILVSTHYDTVPHSPGATDNGAAVATALELLRVLKHRPPLDNDLIFLFADGEETGLLGAQAFIEEHPWAAEVKMVINFDARGTGGPVLMYETGSGNYRLIKEFARAVRYPVATSFSYEVSRRLPNSSDFLVYGKAGLPGFNFACIGGLHNYHTALDNLDRVDLRVIQHQGEYATGLLWHFGNRSLTDFKTPDATYFTAPFAGLIYYPSGWNRPFMLLGVLAAVALAGAGFAGGYLDPLKLLLSGLIWLPVPVAAGLLAFFTWKILSRLQPALEGTIFGDPYRSTFLRAGFALLAVSGVLLWESIAGDTGNFQNRYGGILLVWVILLLLAGRFMNSAVYLIIWPLLSMLSGCGWLLVARNFSAEPHLSLSVFALLALPGIALLIPVLHLMYEALSVQRAWIIAPAVSLFTGLYLPMLPVNNTPVPLLGLAVALFFLTAGAILAGYGPGKPRRDNLFYYYDADQNVARWASTGNKPVARLSRFFEQGYRQHPLPEYFPGQRNLNRKVISAETAGPDFEAPVLELLADTHEGALRRIRLKLRSVRRAAVVTLYLETPPGTVVEEARLAGKVLKDTVNKKLPVRWGIRFWEMPDESIELEIAVRTEAPLNFRVAEQSFDLEKLLPPGFQISSPESIPVPYGGFIPYCVLVARSYRF